MRPSSLALAACVVLVPVAGCKREAAREAATDRERKPTAQRPQKKLPVDKTPLPALAADRGGATGKPGWATGFGGLGIDSPRAIAVAPGGESYVVGYFDGETDLGPAGKHAATANAKEPNKTGSDAFVVKLGADGKIAWGKTFGAGRDDVANGVAVRGDRVVVVGQFLDELALGEFRHPAAGSDDVYVAAFDRAGEPQWLWTAGGIDSDGANTVTAAPDGGWLIGGSFSRTAEFHDIALKSRGGDRKSTRLNSSHLGISYAVFCLKKKKK